MFFKALNMPYIFFPILMSSLLIIYLFLDFSSGTTDISSYLSYCLNRRKYFACVFFLIIVHLIYIFNFRKIISKENKHPFGKNVKSRDYVFLPNIYHIPILISSLNQICLLLSLWLTSPIIIFLK